MDEDRKSTRNEAEFHTVIKDCGVNKQEDENSDESSEVGALCLHCDRRLVWGDLRMVPQL